MTGKKDKEKIESQKREIKHLEDSNEDLKAQLDQYEKADKENGEYTKALEAKNLQLQAQSEELRALIIEKDKVLADLTVVNNQCKTKIDEQASEIQDLTAKYNESLSRLKTVEDKLNTKVSVVVIGLLPWIQRNSPCRLDIYFFYTTQSIVSQRKTDITDKIDTFMHILFRNHKFYNVEMQPEVLDKNAKLTYANLIKIHPHLSPSHDEPFPYSIEEDEFVGIYRGYIFSKTGHLRTSTQSQAKKAAKGTQIVCVLILGLLR